MTGKRWLRRGLSVLLSLCMAAGPCAPSGLQVYAAETETALLSAGSEAPASPSDAEAAGTGNALSDDERAATPSNADPYDEDGFLLDGEVRNDAEMELLPEDLLTPGLLSAPQKPELPELPEIVEGGSREYTIDLRDLGIEPPDPDVLLMGYLSGGIFMDDDVLLSGQLLEASKDPRRKYLTANEKLAYDMIAERFRQISAGEETSTAFRLSPEPFGIDGYHNVLDEFGFEGSMYESANLEEINSLLWDLDMGKVFDALYRDIPYEMYWLDYRSPFSWGQTGPRQLGEHEIELTDDQSIQISFRVDSSYASADSDFKVDRAKTAAAAAARRSAAAIVAEADGLSDFEKLVHYRDAICSRVSYDDNAMHLGPDLLGTLNPWQIIHVFDDDPETRVVCEGYSKAFKYLCDLTDFASPAVECYVVFGDMNGGAHMWNVVAMDDGKRYLVDVTNSDEGMIGEQGGLFLNGYTSGGIQDGYHFFPSGVEIVYVYDEEIFTEYTEEILTLSKTDYAAGHSVSSRTDELHINRESFRGAVGDTVILEAYAVPYYAGDDSLTWSVADAGVASLDRTDGGSVTVTLKKQGTTRITVTAKDRNTVKAYCDITAVIRTNGITLDRGTMTLAVGTSEKLTAAVTPENADNRNVLWKSDDPSVAEVSDDGTVKALKNGSTVIRAVTSDGGYKASCYVTVETPVTGITLEPASLVMKDGDTAELKITFYPESASVPGFSIGSSMTPARTGNVISTSVKDRTITVKAVSAGTAVVTVTTGGGAYSAACNITVMEKIPVESVSLDNSELTMVPGDRKKLTATVLPADAVYPDVTWKSSNISAVSVAQDGTLTANGIGTAKITVTTKDGGFTDSCTVTVLRPVTGVSLDRTSINVGVGETEKLVASVRPYNAGNKNVTWASSAPSVAAVSADGTITGKKTGTAVITVTTEDGGYTASCTVKVIIPVTGVTVSPESLKLHVNDTKTLTASVLPADAGIKTVNWKSSDTSVATVASDGKVTARGAGEAVITATTVNGGFTASCTITVFKPVESIKLDRSSLKIAVGESAVLTTDVLPEDAGDRSVKWGSSNTDIAVVSDDGTVTGVAQGSTVVYAQTVDGGYLAGCEVKVIVPVQSVTLTPASLSMKAGESRDISFAVLPENASDRRVLWSSDNDCVMIDGGTVTAVKPGTAVVTAASRDGYARGTCTVTVTQPVTGVSLTPDTLSMTPWSASILHLEIRPADASNKNVTWRSSDPSVVWVSDGVVSTGDKAGTARIYVTTEDGGYTAVCKVTVTIPVTGVKLAQETMILQPGASSKLVPAFTPENATVQAVTWSSSNPAAAKVASDGTVTGVADGTSVITVTTKDGGFTASCTVTVRRDAEGVVLDRTELSLKPGGTEKLKASILPEGASNPKVSWTTSDASVATVSADGTVTAGKAGTAVITATAEDGGWTASCTVTVSVPVTGVRLQTIEQTLEYGKSVRLVPEVLPALHRFQ